MTNVVKDWRVIYRDNYGAIFFIRYIDGTISYSHVFWCDYKKEVNRLNSLKTVPDNSHSLWSKMLQRGEE